MNQAQRPKVTSGGEQFQRSPWGLPTAKGLGKWLVTYSGGLIKSPRQANLYLFGILVVAILITVVLITSTKNPDAYMDPVTGAERPF